MKMPRPVDSPRPSLRDARPILVRVGSASAIALGFLWITSRVDPDQSRASSAEQTTTIAASPSLPAASMGVLEGRELLVNIVATPDGPRYTVLDRTGAILAERLSQEELYQSFPDLRMDTVVAGPLMLAPTDR